MPEEPDQDGTTDPVAGITAWIVNQGLGEDGVGPLITGLCDKLMATGFPLLRFHVAISMLHPRVEGVGGTWWREGGFEPERYARTSEKPDHWLRSPIRAMIETETLDMRRRLTGPDARIDYDVFEDFVEAGGTEWAAKIVRFGGEDVRSGLEGIAISVVGDRPDGFSDTDYAVFTKLAPSLALACYRIALQDVAVKLLDAYLGVDAGRRVLAGQIERGAATRVSAAILFADMRGFTRLAETVPSDDLLPILNDFLGQVTETVEAHGGEVLKFLGDGLLAVFGPGDDSEAALGTAALAALGAATAAVAGNEAANKARQSAGAPALGLDIALHLGEVMYGNVGSDRRLDFTVIGPAVNEASRIEALCEPLGHSILMSARFQTAIALPATSLGAHSLRGVPEPREIFAPKETGRTVS